ncbi:chorismate mutase [Candidatus Woesearchaeota archaeon]|nr:chorismate mutase [Candidatus Woesearchaeota archaeon]
MGLENIRDKIDSMDEQIVNLIAQRAMLDADIPEWRPKSNNPEYAEIFSKLYDGYIGLVDSTTLAKEHYDKDFDTQILDLLEKRVLFGEKVITDKYRKANGKPFELRNIQREDEVVDHVSDVAAGLNLNRHAVADFYSNIVIPCTIKIEEARLEYLKANEATSSR